ncbi:meiotic recombination [Ceratobasidium sp. 395]|nr:meiotic recombination [Ceratobasidium sp. 395]
MKFLRGRVNALIDQAREEWEQRNEDAGISAEEAGQMMLPLIRLKVETTGVSVMSNPVRFSQEFIGRVANPRDVLVFHRAKSMASRANKVVADEPELSIDDPNISVAEKLQKVRVQNLVREYLAAQELQLLGELGMSDAIQTFVEKDENRSISEFVASSLKAYEKKLNSRGEVHEADLDDALYQIKEEHAKEYEETQLGRAARPKGKGKGKGRAEEEEEDARSADSMEMDDDDMDAVGGGGGGGKDDDDEMSDEVAPAPKKATTSRAKKAPAAKPAAKAKAAAKPAAKSKAKAPAKGKAKALFIPGSDDDDAEVIDLPSEEEEEEEPAPPPKPKGRAGVLSQATKGATKSTAKTRQTKLTAGTSKTTTTRAPRAAAKSARSKVQAAIELSD